MSGLSAQQDHHLKNQLVLLLLQKEFDRAWQDHVEFLGNLGYPFSDGSRLEKAEDLLGTWDDQYLLLKFIYINFVKTFPYFRNVDRKYKFREGGMEGELVEAGEDDGDSGVMDQYDHTNNNKFWRYKMMPFFNYILGKNLSNSVDRLELTKRKKANLKIFRLFVLFFSSCITTTKEDQYYLGLKDPGNVSKLTGHELDKKIYNDMQISLQKLENGEHNLLRELENPQFVNGYVVSIVGVKKLTNEDTGMLSSILKRQAVKTYEFIVSVKYKVLQDNVQEFIIYRSYSEFKKLSVILKKSFPEITLPQLPQKHKHATLMNSLFAEEPDNGAATHLDEAFFGEELDNKEALEYVLTKYSKDKLEKPSGDVVLPREKLRIMLNNYLKALVKLPKVANSLCMKEFLCKGSVSMAILTDEEKQDITYRKQLDFLSYKNQIIFQKKIFLINLKLKNELATFKNIIFNSNNPEYLASNFPPGKIKEYQRYLNKNVLSTLLEEFKTNCVITKFSPIIKTLIKWIKFQLASIIYGVFFTNSTSDISLFEVFGQIKKLHSLFPYTILQQILRLTNPLSIIKKLLDFFLYQPPTLLPGFWSSDTGHRSLIQVLFHNVISSDLSEINSKIAELSRKLVAQDPRYAVFEDTFRLFLAMNENRHSVKKSIIEKHKRKKGSDLILTILHDDNLSNNPTLQELRPVVLQAYLETKQPEHEKNLYYDLKTLFQLLIRQNDKIIMTELWSESYLNNFLKDFLVIFFEPLIKIFTRNKLFKRVIKVFQSFMDDMIQLIEYLFDYIYVMNANEVILSIYLVISKYQDFMLEFVHETYLNDSEGFFENVVSWISSIIGLLRYFKTDSSKKLDMDQILNIADIPKLKTEINDIMARKKKLVVNQALKAEVNKNAAAANPEPIKNNWDSANEVTFFDSTELGFNSADIEEFNAELDMLQKIDSRDSNAVETFLDESKNYYTQNDIPESNNFSEIEKLSNPFKQHLARLLKTYQANNPI